MTWVRLDDEFPEHPKVVAVGPLGLALQVAGLAYCNRNLTDGFIPKAQARRLLDWHSPTIDFRAEWAIGISMPDEGESFAGPGYDVDSRYVIDLLLTVGLWEEVPGGYRIHDYEEFQPLREVVEREREMTRERVKRHRERQRNGVTPEVSNGEGNGGETDAPYPSPNPNQDPKRESKSLRPLLALRRTAGEKSQ